MIVDPGLVGCDGVGVGSLGINIGRSNVVLHSRKGMMMC